MAYSANKYGEILWYRYFLLQEIAGMQKSGLDLFYHPSSNLSLAFFLLLFSPGTPAMTDGLLCLRLCLFSFAATNILYSYLVLVSGKNSTLKTKTSTLIY